MSVTLEPVFLANVLLNLNDVVPIAVFPFISKKCLMATLTLKTNPSWVFSTPRDILMFFPNINTMVVRDLLCFEDTDTLPDTVTALVVEHLDFRCLTAERLGVADRVVEIRGCHDDDKHPANFTLFPNIDRLTLTGVPRRLILPKHKLKRLWLHHVLDDDVFSIVPPECAEQINIVFVFREAFLGAKRRSLPQNVRIFCPEIGDGVAPEDFFSSCPFGDVTLSDGFGVDELRVFHEKTLFRLDNVTMTFNAACAECDVSFLTQVTSLKVENLQGCTLTLPTSIVQLHIDNTTKGVTLSGTDNVRGLTLSGENITSTPCPMLETMVWEGKVLSEETLPFPIHCVTTLSEMSIRADEIKPGFHFPTGLTELLLTVHGGSVDVTLLTMLTRLQALDINVDPDTDPLDLSGLTAVTKLDANESPVTGLPTSLLELSLCLKVDTDFSPLTDLTSLSLSLEPNTHVTLPTGLKTLDLKEGELANTNIGAVALESFEPGWGHQLTHDELSTLPKTLKRLSGEFNPATLEGRLGEYFPLLET